MPYALTGTEITEAQLSALGGDFSGDNWQEELARVRAEALDALRIDFGELRSSVHKREAIVSGPWPITGQTLQMTRGGLAFLPGQKIIFALGIFRDEVQYILPETTGAEVRTEIHFFGSTPPLQEPIVNGAPLNPEDSTRTFRAILRTAGKSGRLYGIFTSSVNGPDSEITINCNVNHSITSNGFVKTIIIDDHNFSGGEVSIVATRGASTWRGSAGNQGLGASTQGLLRWTHFERQTSPAIGINRNARVLKIVPPQARDIGVFMPQGDDVTLINGEFDVPARYYHNLGEISYTISPDSLHSGIDNQRGVWICKTLPVGSVEVGASIAPGSVAPTNPSTSGAWGVVSSAIEYQIPRYHFRRNTNGQQPPTPADERPPLGSCITSIFLRRAPVRSGDYYVQNPAASSTTVRLGHYKTSTGFESHQTVTFAAGEVQKWVTLDQDIWPILSHDYLLYDSSEQFDVQAVTCSPLDMVLFDGEGSTAVPYPIMPWHYEDTERLQNA